MIISVASGKGGTGKTLVATSLALSLGDDAQLVDCDVEAPNAHLFLRPSTLQNQPVCIPVPRVDEGRCTFCGECARVCAYNALAVFKRKVLVFHELCHGCGACAYLCPEKAITEEGREIGVVRTGRAGGIDFVQGELTVGEAMSPPVIREVKRLLDTGKTVIVDSPPGTSCPVVESVRGADYCLLVTEPTPFGLYDLSLAVEMAQEVGVPCGIVLNRATTDDSTVEEFCRERGLPVLMRIPLDRRIAEFYSEGVTLVEGMPDWRPAFRELAGRIRNGLAVKSEMVRL